MGSRRLCKLQKRCTPLAAESVKAYHLPTYRRWFSPGTPASPTTTTGRHDIAEILLKVASNQMKSYNMTFIVDANVCNMTHYLYSGEAV